MGKDARAWAKEFKNGNKWNVWQALLVVSVISSAISFVTQLLAGPDPENPAAIASIAESLLGIAILPISIGLILYIVNLIKGRKYELGQLFSRYGDFVRIFVTTLLEGIIIFLFTLLFIIPGIIRSFAYSLVNYILADDDFKDLGAKEILDLSKKLMDGHKVELFCMNFYYTIMMILGCFTFGILWIWTIPEMTLANAKFATDLLDEYKKENKSKK